MKTGFDIEQFLNLDDYATEERVSRRKNSEVNSQEFFTPYSIVKRMADKIPDVDWSVSPSNAAASNPDLVLKISKDGQINPFIFTIDNNFDFKVVADKIKDLAMIISNLKQICKNC